MRMIQLLCGAIMAGLGVSPVVQTRPPQPTIAAQAAIVINAATGTILYEKQAFRQMDPASLTKMMTAAIIIRAGHLDRLVPVSSEAALVEGSKLHILPGQRYTVRDLLRGLLLRSGNDAAIALAEAESGSVERFAARMNRTAQAWGAFNTAFRNPNGLTESGHYSSAYDLALIARRAMALPRFRAIVAQREATVEERTTGTQRKIRTTNRLLLEFPGADGIKTGTTVAAGQCLVASARRHGYRLIAVVLKSRNRWHDAAHLLDWGFQHWTMHTLYHRGQIVRRVRVVGGRVRTVALLASRTVAVSVPVGAQVKVKAEFPETLRAPVRKQTPVGYIQIWPEDELPIRLAVLPQQAVKAKCFAPRWPAVGAVSRGRWACPV